MLIVTVFNTNHFPKNTQMLAELTFIKHWKTVLVFLTITWLIQVKDGKLLDEMAVSVTGLANKVGRADVCHTGAKPIS